MHGEMWENGKNITNHKKIINTPNNINFEINTKIISGEGSLHQYLNYKIRKNVGIIVDQNLFKNSFYIRKCLRKDREN